MGDPIQLIDLPDELILNIMNKVKPRVLLLCSVISIGNIRLEKLALDQCHSIDLSFDYVQSPYQSLLQRFYSHVMPYIVNNIQSMTLNIRDISRLTLFAERNSGGTLPNLKHLKIMIGRLNSITGTPCTLGKLTNQCIKTTFGYNLYGISRDDPLSSNIPQFITMNVNKCDAARTLFTFLCSSMMRSVLSLELDDNCILANLFKNNDLVFRKSIHLTHIRMTFFQFDDCIYLLNQLGSQVHSFAVNCMFVCDTGDEILPKIKSISCPNLKQLTIIIYRTISHYEDLFLPVLQQLSNVEYLTLLLAIGFERTGRKRFIDGFDLEKDITSYMPHLHQFHFHIRSILKDVSYVEIDTIRQSFVKQQQSVDFAIDYFKNDRSQCEIYSHPFIGTRLDFVSNRFPLFDTTRTFSMVTKLILFDDMKPFESVFFERVSRALPRLHTLDVINELEHQEKLETTTNNLEFPRLATLILFNMHFDYAEQFLCRAHLPCLVELAIDNDVLLTIIAQNQQRAKDNCSKIEYLRTLDPFSHSLNALQDFFPPSSYVEHPHELEKDK